MEANGASQWKNWDSDAIWIMALNHKKPQAWDDDDGDDLVMIFIVLIVILTVKI